MTFNESRIESSEQFSPPNADEMASTDLNIGIVGAGIGGVMASIAIARAGGKVTILEAAHQLGEIGAGIQMVDASRKSLSGIR